MPAEARSVDVGDADEHAQAAARLGVSIGRYPTGPLNAITDVAGVRVGHTTLISGEGPLERGKGPVRTGVTCVMPHVDVYRERLIGGTFVLNGAGEVAGLTQVAEWGLLETPILLTNTHGGRQGLGRGGQVDDEEAPRHRQRRRRGHPAGRRVRRLVPQRRRRAPHPHREHVYSAIEKATGGPVPRARSAPAPA